jgi:hypothetical protein
MIGTLTVMCLDGVRSIRIWGKDLTTAKLATLASTLQTYTNGYIKEAALWESQDLTGMHTPETEEKYDNAQCKGIMTFRRTNAPAGRPYTSRLNWPAPKSQLFEMVSAGIKNGYRVKNTYGAMFAGIIQDETNRELVFEMGWLKDKK